LCIVAVGWDLAEISISYDDIVAFVVTLMKKAGYDEKSKQILAFIKLLLSLG